MTSEQRQLLTGMMNRIIPEQGNMPGAGDLGLASFVEKAISSDVVLRRQIIEGLVETEIAARKAAGVDFCGLDPDGQDSILRAMESTKPIFFGELVRQTYSGYYTNYRVFQSMDYAPPEPKPKGSPPELLDQKLLNKQRERVPFWRGA